MIGSVMSKKLGHFRVVKRETQVLRLERRSELPLLLAVLGGVLFIVVWFLRAWQFASGLIVSIVLVILSLPGIITVLYLRPWKEVLILDRVAGKFVRKEQYLLRRNKIMDLPLDTIASAAPVQRTIRVTDKKGQMVDHVYWAALLRSTSGEETDLDGANDLERIRELTQVINDFIAKPSPRTP
jgi:hypothetical protein